MTASIARRSAGVGESETRLRWGTPAVLLAAVGLGLAGWWLHSPAVSVAGPVALLIMVRERRRRRSARRHRLLVEQLIQIVDHLTLATRSGAGLTSALAELRADTARFGRSAIGAAAIAPMVDAVRRHRPVAEAASLLLHAADRPVRLIGATLHTAGRTGGPVGSALVGLRHTLVGIVHGEDRRLAESTQALASAAMLSLLPVGFATLAAFADREVAAFYLRDAAGAGCLLGAIGLGYGGWIWMRRQVDRTLGGGRVRLMSRGEREAAALEDLVGTIEMTAAVVGAGGTIGDALDGLALYGPNGVVSAFVRVAERRRSALVLVDALAPAVDELGPAFHPFVGAMLMSASGGAPVGSFLQRLGDDADSARRRSADIRARRLSVALLPPLVLCHLPALVIGALAPVVIVAVGHLGR